MIVTEQPLALGLRLAAGLEGLAALHLAAAVRPHARVGALVTTTLGHSLRTVALTLEPEVQRRRERLAVELAMSAALAALLLQAARAARWEG